MPRSPLAPDSFPALPPVAGVGLAVGRWGGYPTRDRDDLVLAVFDAGTTVAGVLTRSRTASAPIHWCRAALPGGRARAIVVNAGNANAFTAKSGDLLVDTTVDRAAALFGCPRTEVFVASTGVIGQRIQAPDAIAAHLPALAAAAAAAPAEPEAATALWRAAALAIGTTDTYPKGSAATATIDGTPVTIAGIAKGSGMIAPDMATMLAFVFTDAALPAAVLEALVGPINQRTFNAITVDGDTSTSDTLLVAATGRARHLPVTAADDPRLAGLAAALETVMRDLAHQVVRDGEGATKFVTIRVSGAVDAASARRVGLAVANSPLVKTAIAGADANWGRIVMAVGKAGEPADRDLLSLAIGGLPITACGALVPDYDETPVAAHMRGSEIEIGIDLGLGDGAATVWTCDLTQRYISINADYRS